MLNSTALHLLELGETVYATPETLDAIRGQVKTRFKDYHILRTRRAPAGRIALWIELESERGYDGAGNEQDVIFHA